MSAIRRTRSTELLWKIHRWLYSVSGGRIGGRLGALPVLLLTVRGRRSGEPLSVALSYLLDRGAYVVFATHAGEDRDPPWWLNLRDAGAAEVQIGARRFRVRAAEVQGEERDGLYARVTEADEAYGVYQERTKRRIAVVRLEPTT